MDGYAKAKGSGVVIETLDKGTNYTALFAGLNEFWGGIFFKRLDREIAREFPQ